MDVYIDDCRDGAVLRIEHRRERGSDFYFLDPSDEKTVAGWIYDNLGEAINSQNGCPIFSEVAGWAFINAGYDGLEYTLEDYPDINGDEWSITLWNLSEDEF